MFRDDIRARFGSKTPLGEYAGCLYEMSAFMIANRNTIQHLLKGVASLMARASAPESKKGRQDAAIANVELSALNALAMLAKYCPQSFEGAQDFIKDILDRIVGIDGDVKASEATSKSTKRAKSEALEDANNDGLLVIKNRDLLGQILTIIKGTAPFLWPLDSAEAEQPEKPNQRRASHEPTSRSSSLKIENNLCHALLDYASRCSETEACYALAETACSLLTVGGRPPEDNPRWKHFVPSRVSSILATYINPVLKSSSVSESIGRLPFVLFNLAALLKTGGQPAINSEKALADFCLGAFVKSSISGISDREDAASGILRGCIKAWTSCIDVIESSRDASSSKAAGKTSSGSEGEHKPESFHTEGSRLSVLENTRRFLGLTLNCIASHGATFGNYSVSFCNVYPATATILIFE